jgi:hypothetical protein
MKLLIGVVLVWIGVAVVQFFVFCDMETRGQFGDMFGAVNALFSGLAFAVIYRSLVTQHTEIQAQRVQFQQQVELAALTAYADLTRALWENNAKQYEKEPTEFWGGAMKMRYEEMMKARDAFTKILKERGVL